MRSGLEDYRQNLHFDAKVELDAHTLGSVSDLVPIAAVREERCRNNPEDAIPSVASASANPTAWIPELTESDDVYVVDVVRGGLLTVRPLQKGHRLQLRRQASSVLN
jgi:hypothetical protein